MTIYPVDLNKIQFLEMANEGLKGEVARLKAELRSMELLNDATVEDIEQLEELLNNMDI